MKEARDQLFIQPAMRIVLYAECQGNNVMTQVSHALCCIIPTTNNSNNNNNDNNKKSSSTTTTT